MSKEAIFGLEDEFMYHNGVKYVPAKRLDEVKKELHNAFTAGFFKSHCSHNGEMIDKVELKELNQSKKQYCEDMFKDWLSQNKKQGE